MARTRSNTDTASDETTADEAAEAVVEAAAPPVRRWQIREDARIHATDDDPGEEVLRVSVGANPAVTVERGSVLEISDETVCALLEQSPHVEEVL